MKKYWLNLKNHPGLGIACYMTLFLEGAGLLNKNDWHTGVALASGISALIWLTVLRTARTSKQ